VFSVTDTKKYLRRRDADHLSKQLVSCHHFTPGCGCAYVDPSDTIPLPSHNVSHLLKAASFISFQANNKQQRISSLFSTQSAPEKTNEPLLRTHTHSSHIYAFVNTRKRQHYGYNNCNYPHKCSATYETPQWHGRSSPCDPSSYLSRIESGRRNE
jgi:hypothetical protein